MMNFKNFSIKWQFSILITLVALPFILLSFYNLADEKRKETEKSKNLAISIARSIGLQQKNAEAYTRQMLSLISKLPELQKPMPDKEELNQLFKAVLAENPQFAVVLSALPDGNAYASAIPYKPFSVSDRKYYKDVMRTRSFAVGELAKSRLTNRAVLHYALPVLNSENNVKLILIASFDLSQYHNILSVSSLSKGSDFAFYDYSGRMLYDSQNHQRLLGKRGTPQIKKAILASSDEGAFYAEDSYGKKRLYGFVRINIDKNSPYMYIVVGTPLTQTFKDANMQFYRNIIITILAILFSILAFIYYKNLIFGNIAKLVTVANNFKDGDLTVRTNMNYQAGETGALAMALDKMAETILIREYEQAAINNNLRIMAERMEIAVNAARIGIWEWDISSNKVFWNEQMYDLYNVNINSFKGLMADWMKYLHPDDSVRIEEEFHHSIRHKKNNKTSFRIINKQKGYKNIRCYYTVICDINGKALHLTGINMDVTEKVFLEHELTHTKELLDSKLNSIKSDLKNTLTAFNDKFNMLVDRIEKTDRSLTKDDLDSIKKQITGWKNDVSEELQQISENI